MYIKTKKLKSQHYTIYDHRKHDITSNRKDADTFIAMFAGMKEWLHLKQTALLVILEL